MTMNFETVLLRELSRSIDPVAFCQSCGIEPDAWQRDLLTSDDPRIILNCSRQSGKSELTSILALYHAINNPEALVLILSPSIRQSQELFKKIIDHYHGSGRPLPSTIESATALKLSNGARIVSLPSKEATIRGFSSVSLLLIDEAARVEDDLYYSTRPMLAVSQGRLILLSTPSGKRGFFFHEFTDGAGWKRIKITADQCPRIAPEFLAEERKVLGDRFFEQEYMAKFHEAEDSLFSVDQIEAALSDFDEIPLDLDLDIDEEDVEKTLVEKPPDGFPRFDIDLLENRGAKKQHG